MEMMKEREKEEVEVEVEELEPPAFSKPNVSSAFSETTKNIFLSECIEIIGKGLDSEKTGNFEAAFNYFNRGLEMLLTLIKEESSEARKNMFRVKFNEIMEKAEHLKKLIKDTPSTSTEGHDVITEKLISNRIQEEEDLEEIQQSECETIMGIEGVKCFSIMGNERHLISEGTLQLLRTKDSIGLNFMKLGEFEFPLTKNIPCLRASKRYYMVPMPGNVFYGFVFPEIIPDQYLTIFENQLEQLCILRKQEIVIKSEPIPKPTTSTSTKTTEASSEVVPVNNNTQIIAHEPKDFTVTALENVATGLEIGAKFAVSGIIKGSQLIADGVDTAGQYLKTKITPNETALVVPPKVATTLSVASKVTPVAVKISKVLVKGLVKVAEEIGSAVAESIHESEWGKKQTGTGGRFNGPKTDAAKKLGASTLLAITDVWESLETAGRTLLKQTAATSVDVVEHKFGKEAAQTTQDGFSVAVDTVEIAYNVKQLGVKKIAKKVAKETAKSTVKGYMKEKEEPVPQLEGPPPQLLLQD